MYNDCYGYLVAILCPSESRFRITIASSEADCKNTYIHKSPTSANRDKKR